MHGADPVEHLDGRWHGHHVAQNGEHQGGEQRRARPLILIPALAMLGVVVTSFMQVGRGLVIVRLFAAAGVLWLLILLALGSLDPLTRVVYPVERQSGSG